MEKKIVLIYKSVTGYTKTYAEAIGRELGCPLIKLEDVQEKDVQGADILIFGSRVHGGKVDGLKRAKRIFAHSGAKTLVLYATGAMPREAEKSIEEMWRTNLPTDGDMGVAHFYFPGGLCYEKMPWADRMMMKAFLAMLKGKKEKSESDKMIASHIASSYDISSMRYIEPLLETVRRQLTQA